MGEFAVNLERFYEKASGNCRVVPRKAAMELFRSVILGTPVDKGAARGNWQASMGAPAEGAVETPDQSGVRAVSGMQQVINGWGVKDDSVFLTNNLPYIERLENGYSKQAPAGMVAINVARWDGIVDDIPKGEHGGAE